MNSRALVTGASRGIGAAIAEALASAGHPVIINYRRHQIEAEAVKARIEAKGGHAELAPFDVSRRDETRLAIDALLAGDPIGVVVNNAGVIRDKPFPALLPEDWDLIIDTTLDAFFNVTQPLVLPMVRRRWGRIINITSYSGVAGNRGQVHYSAAKAGLIGATKALAKELAPRSITVNAIAPGVIDTSMTRHLPPAVMESIPMRRIGRPDEVAELAAFLASEQSAYITGQVININGGLI